MRAAIAAVNGRPLIGFIISKLEIHVLRRVATSIRR
jgi:hypothetical protein